MPFQDNFRNSSMLTTVAAKAFSNWLSRYVLGGAGVVGCGLLGESDSDVVGGLLL